MTTPVDPAKYNPGDAGDPDEQVACPPDVFGRIKSAGGPILIEWARIVPRWVREAATLPETSVDDLRWIFGRLAANPAMQLSLLTVMTLGDATALGVFLEALVPKWNVKRDDEWGLCHGLAIAFFAKVGIETRPYAQHDGQSPPSVQRAHVAPGWACRMWGAASPLGPGDREKALRRASRDEEWRAAALTVLNLGCRETFWRFVQESAP